ncbi:inositol monophosphatase family protein [Roseobacter sp. CCS2]|uniref:inositol monophosphatase family protein n=1 Tax=Roseobacter sp. CCS2 TaxID=391593 RepID=UPI0000F3E58F|nr:inositol monophosphatase family protein [Roseobacter sp. CCS2]EBA11979.1 Inositol monophosphatase family protein [Roseobacter sp. CCS2]
MTTDAQQFLPQAASNTLCIMAEAALLAGQGLLAASERLTGLTVTEKTAGDFVSEADVQAEKVIFDHLMQAFPDYGWLGEETQERASRADGLRWIVDPLDGTTNFLKGLPHWAVSIALFKVDEPLVALIYDPVKAEMFCAEKGAGAYLNGRKITVSAAVPIGAALVASGVPAGGRTTYLPHCLDDLEQLMPQTAGLRRWGAAALDLAYVAAGRFDAYWERNLGPWDIAAGMLIVTEAGGRFTPLWVDRPVLSSGSFLASNGALHDAVAATLNKAQV